MIERRVVSRYAAALFSAALKADAVDRVESDLGMISYLMEANPNLVSAMRSPVVGDETKKAILGDVSRGSLHEITLRYLDLLIEKKREEVLFLTEEEYIKLADVHRGIINAEVYSAVALSGDQVELLQAKLSATTGKRVQIAGHVDPTLLGGVQVRIGDTVIDGSIKGQLDALRHQLLGS
jgi:F-type H+-transporting ATPase subunit delta